MFQIDSSVLPFLGSTVETDVEADEGSAWGYLPKCWDTGGRSGRGGGDPGRGGGGGQRPRIPTRLRRVRHLVLPALRPGQYSTPAWFFTDSIFQCLKFQCLKGKILGAGIYISRLRSCKDLLVITSLSLLIWLPTIIDFQLLTYRNFAAQNFQKSLRLILIEC